MSTPNAVTVAAERSSLPQVFSLAPRNFDEAWRLATILADSDLAPKDFRGSPENCFLAIQWGNEIGLGALQALQNIAVVNGRPALWGDAVLALVRSSPVFESIVETDDGTTATCRVRRRGEPELVRTFSADDAKRAGLLGKQGPWQQYPQRMRQMRARSFALRDGFADVLKGMPMAEEVMDLPPAARQMGMVDEVAPPAQTKPDLPPYPDSDFERNMPAWWRLVADGKKTASDLLATLQTRATFSDEQQARILSLQPTPVAELVDQFIAEMDAASEGE